MQNFIFHTQTKVWFGKDTHKLAGEAVASYGYNKVLLHYGQNSIKTYGIYDDVVTSLKAHNIDYVELGGVEPNPKLSLVRQGIELCKREGIQLILAIGGGSAIDSAKLMAHGAVVDFDAWQFSLRQAEPKSALPVGVVLTLAASGSEMSSSCVISDGDTGTKRGFPSPYNRPLFALCNPELTYTLPPFQTGCGVVDILMHTWERYFGNSAAWEPTDAIAEGVSRAVIQAGLTLMDNPKDYDARATLMWAGSLSHNDLTGVGRTYFMACHQIEHEISGMFDHVAHAAGLAVVFPAWARYIYKHNVARFAQFARNVWSIRDDADESAAVAGIEATVAYFKRIGMPTTWNELNTNSKPFDELADNTAFHGKRVLPSYIDLGKDEIAEILRISDR